MILLTDADGDVWVERRPDTGLLAGLWAPPTVDSLDDGLARLGLTADTVDNLGTVEHVFTHKRWTMRVWRADAPGDSPPRDGSGRFVPPSSTAEVGVATAHRKAFALLQARNA